MMSCLDVYKENKKHGGTQMGIIWQMAAEVEGIYVPAFYDVTYKEDGTIEFICTESIQMQKKRSRSSL